MVEGGDDLKSLAQKAYGNSCLWYVLAAANALSGDSGLIAGTQLKVPEVGVSKNDAGTFKPYNPNEIVGSTSPSLPYIPPPGSLSCKQTMILLATTIVRVVATFYGGVGGTMLADALMQKVEINAGIRSKYSLGETVAAGVFALFAPAIQGATGWARAGYAAVAAATAYTGSYLVDKTRGADVHFNWSNLAASVVTSMISTKLGAVGNTGVAAGGTVSSALNSTAFSWAKVASDAVNNLAISVVNKGVTQLITGDKAQWDAGAMFADSFGNALGSAIAVKMNQKILSYDECRSLKAMTPQAQNEYKANRAQSMSSRQAYDYVTNAGGLRAMGDAWFGLEAEEVYAGPQYIEDAETTEQLASFVQKYGKDAMTGIKLADNRPMGSIQEMYGIDDHMESTESSREELLTKEVFKEIFPKAKQSMIDSIYPYLMEEMYANDINTNERMAAFLAQGYVETGGLMNLKEIEGYKLASARTAFPSTLKGKSDQEVIKLLSSSESFLNFVYAAPKNGNRPGTNDGYTYLGRGFFMSTGYDKYAEMTSLTGIDFLSNPKLMAQPEYAAKSAVQFWENNNFNNYADKITGEVKVWRVGKKWNSNQPSFLDISTTINGGYMHIQDRAIAYNRIYKILTTSNVAMRSH